MKYILLIYETPGNLQSRKDPGPDPYIAAWRAYHKTLVAAGAYVDGAPLKDVATATTVRLKNGRRHVQDGPFVEAKEQLGGFVILDVPIPRRGARVGGALPRGGDRLRRSPAGGRRLSRHVRWKPDFVEDARGTVEAVARASYGRLLAYLSSETRDVAGAEDALGDALVAALTSWPRDGVPRQPESWLLTAARHRLIDQARRRRVRDEHEGTLRHLADESTATEVGGRRVSRSARRAALRLRAPGDRARPAHAADAPDRARASTPRASRRRSLSRRRPWASGSCGPSGRSARRASPSRSRRSRSCRQRLDAVLEAIYAAYDLGRDEAAGIEPGALGLAGRGGLARARDPGALARGARDPGARWPSCSSARRVAPRDGHPTAASSRCRNRSPPRGRRRPSARPRPSSARQREWGGSGGSSSKPPSSRSTSIARRPGAPTGPRSSASTNTSSAWLPRSGPGWRRPPPWPRSAAPRPGLALLDTIDRAAVATYQPYWAVRAHLLRQAGEAAGAAEAYDRAIGLTEDPATRRFLLERRG